jgi:hypothetical protein
MYVCMYVCVCTYVCLHVCMYIVYECMYIGIGLSLLYLVERAWLFSCQYQRVGRVHAQSNVNIIYSSMKLFATNGDW